MLHHIPRPFGLGIFLWWTVQDSNSTAERSEGNQNPGGHWTSSAGWFILGAAKKTEEQGSAE